MPTRVLLVPSHFLFQMAAGDTPHELPQGYGQILKPEMFLWPIRYWKCNQELPEKYATAYRSCLYALLDLKHFTSAVSILADPHTQTLSTVVHDWCQIYLNGYVVAEFRYYNRLNALRVLNIPFESYSEWSDLPFTNFSEWPERVSEKRVLAWGPEDWRKFFFEEIRTYSRVQLCYQGINEDARRFFRSVLDLVHEK